MARKSREESGNSTGIIIAVVGGIGLLACLICAGGGAVVYFVWGKEKVAANRPNEIPKQNTVSVTYRVTGNPPPDKQADRIKKTIGALPGIQPGSVSVTPTEIQFRIAQGVPFTDAYDAVTKQLGYNVTLTSSNSGPPPSP